MIAVSLDGKMVKVCVCIPIQPPPFRALRNFFGQESHCPPKSEGARTPMGKSITIYGLVDSGSDVTTIDPSLTEQLEIQSEARQLFLSTVYQRERGNKV